VLVRLWADGCYPADRPGLDSHLLSIAPAWRTSHGQTARSFVAPCWTGASLHLVTNFRFAILSHTVVCPRTCHIERYDDFDLDAFADSLGIPSFPFR